MSTGQPLGLTTCGSKCIRVFAMQVPQLHHARYVIWDWNGTLLDDVSLVVEIMDGLLREFGLCGLDVDRYRDTFEFPVEKYYRKLGFDEGHPSFQILATRFMQEYDRRVLECPLHVDVREVLNSLLDRGIINIILTSGKRESVQTLIRHHGLDHVFCEVIGHEDHFAGSKDYLGRAWLQQRRVNEQVLIFVGDTVHDFDVAKAMQVQCVLVSHGYNSERDLLRCGCPVVPSLRDFFLRANIT